MIKIMAPQKKEAIIELIDNKIIEDITFKYIKTEGLMLYFETSSDDVAALVAKKTIKMSSFGRAIMFNVEKC